jgi:alanyl aminopeptidase
MIRRSSLLLLLVACATEAPQTKTTTEAPPAAPAPVPDLTPPTLRLPEGIRPTRYQVELTIPSAKDRFTGSAVVELVLDHPAQVIWLNAEGLTLRHASLVAQGRPHEAKIVPQPKDFVGLTFDAPVPAGAAQLRIQYEGTSSDKERTGASRQKLGDDYYLFTHFEPIDARRVFPCFDEPSFKIPWKVSIVAAKGDVAYANGKLLSTTDLPDGSKRFEFDTTKPLPSYLVAFAVGPIEALDAGQTRHSQTPVRILVPKGMGDRAGWAVKTTAEILSRLEDYFGIDYAYGKLDLIAVPQFGGNAMENAGLVTFGMNLILAAPDDESIYFRRTFGEVAAHELAHQWFGDLVTTAWWDDIWLNEAFATWLTPKIVEGWQPTWGEAEERVESRNGSLEQDSLLSARRIRQPITSNGDMKNAFDGITYQKGATVIGTFEGWVGEEPFRRGVQRYMREHAFGNATAPQFLAAISAEAGKDVAPAFSTFLDQAGAPLVSASLECAAAPQLKLTQERYLPQGSQPTAEQAGQTWQIPLCARWMSVGVEGHACTLLGSKEGTLVLEGAKQCPEWVVLNPAGRGYFRSRYDGDLMKRLLERGSKALTAPEQLSLAGDLEALAEAGTIPYTDALALVPTWAKSANLHVVTHAAEMVGHLRDSHLLPLALHPAYARFVRSAFGQRAQQLAWTPKKGEDEDTRLMRETVVPLVADQGQDGKLAAQAEGLAKAWLADHRAVDPNLVSAVLRVAASRGDRALFDRFRQAAVAEKDSRNRQRLLAALASFRKPEITQEAMGLVLGDEFDPRETPSLVWGSMGALETRPAAYAFVRAHYEQLSGKLPRDSAGYFPYFGAALCDESQADDIKAFFTERSSHVDGGPRLLDQALEELRLCAIRREAQGPSVAKFFATR